MWCGQDIHHIIDHKKIRLSKRFETLFDQREASVESTITMTKKSETNIEDVDTSHPSKI